MVFPWQHLEEGQHGSRGNVRNETDVQDMKLSVVHTVRTSILAVSVLKQSIDSSLLRARAAVPPVTTRGCFKSGELSGSFKTEPVDAGI